MEIISYNIWNLPLRMGNRKRQVLEIAKALAERGAEIICIQESWNLSARKAFSEYMQTKGYYDAVQHAQVKRNNGGLLTFSKFPIKSVHFVPFGRRTLSLSEFIGNKGVLETIVGTPNGLLRILNTHLDYQSSRFTTPQRGRLRQLHTLFKTFNHEASLPNILATILAGDFNEHNMTEQKLFTEVFEKAGFVHHDNDAELFSTYRKENHHVNNWLNRITESRRYDYIFTKDIEKAGLSFVSYAPWYIDPPLSDHDPIVLTLSGILS